MSKSHREIEAKFYIGKLASSSASVQHRLEQCGFGFEGVAVERDFLPDTPDGACKHHNLLFRVREIITLDQTVLLLTVKFRKDAVGYIEFEERETLLDDPDYATLNYINELLAKVTGIRLPANIFVNTSIDEMTRRLQQAGFTRMRIRLDKYRKTYRHDTTTANIDIFPDKMGVYLELESDKPRLLKESIQRLGLQPTSVITIDYGDLLKQHKSGMSSSNQRKAVFTDEFINRTLRTKK